MLMFRSDCETFVFDIEYFFYQNYVPSNVITFIRYSKGNIEISRSSRRVSRPSGGGGVEVPMY